MYQTIQLQTAAGESIVNISAQVQERVKSSGVAEGLCAIFVPHTTAAISLNSGMDPKTALDLIAELKRIVPTRVDFNHQFDTPADAAGHIKASLVGDSVTLIVSGGSAVLGSSQSVLFFEFDGPRERKVLVQIIGK